MVSTGGMNFRVCIHVCKNARKNIESVSNFGFILSCLQTRSSTWTTVQDTHPLTTFTTTTQMENIGYFLDASRLYGLRDSDLFITVDLFEEQNMDQVRSDKRTHTYNKSDRSQISVSGSRSTLSSSGIDRYPLTNRHSWITVPGSRSSPLALPQRLSQTHRHLRTSVSAAAAQPLRFFNDSLKHRHSLICLSQTHTGGHLPERAEKAGRVAGISHLSRTRVPKRSNAALGCEGEEYVWPAPLIHY